MRVEGTGIPLVLMLATLLIFAGCGGGGASGGASSGAGGEGGGSGMMEEDVASGAGGSEGDIAQSAGAGEEAASAEGSGGEGDAALPEDFDRRVIRSADLGIRAEDVRASAVRAGDVAEKYGGAVLGSNTSEDGDDDVYAELVISVPAQDFENALADIRSLPGKVVNDSVSGQDVTEEFVDLESRERNLLAAEASLLKLYDRAESVEDTLVVERELTNVRGEIEQVQGRVKFLESRTEFSRISLNVSPVPTPGPNLAWQPDRVASSAWDASLAVLQAAATAIIAVLVFGWLWIPLLVGGLIFRRRYRQPAPQQPPA